MVKLFISQQEIVKFHGNKEKIQQIFNELEPYKDLVRSRQTGGLFGVGNQNSICLNVSSGQKHYFLQVKKRTVVVWSALHQDPMDSSRNDTDRVEQYLKEFNLNMDEMSKRHNDVWLELVPHTYEATYTTEPKEDKIALNQWNPGRFGLISNLQTWCDNHDFVYNFYSDHSTLMLDITAPSLEDAIMFELTFDVWKPNINIWKTE